MRMKQRSLRQLAQLLNLGLVVSVLSIVTIAISAEASSTQFGNAAWRTNFYGDKVASVRVIAGSQCYERLAGRCRVTITKNPSAQEVIPLPGVVGATYYVIKPMNAVTQYRAQLTVSNGSSRLSVSYGNIYAFKPGEYFLFRLDAPANRHAAVTFLFSLGSANPGFAEEYSEVDWTYGSGDGREGHYDTAPSNLNVALSGQMQVGQQIEAVITYRGVDVILNNRTWMRSRTSALGCNVPPGQVGTAGGVEVLDPRREQGGKFTLGLGELGKYISFQVNAINMYGAVSSSTACLLVTAAPEAGRRSEFGSITSTFGGFKVDVTNYDASFSYSATVTGGSVIVGAASGTKLPLTVTGLSSAQNVEVTVTTSKTGFTNGTGVVAGVSLPSALTSSSGPVGRWIASSIAKQNKTLLIADQGGYLYTSTDNGLNWAQRSSPQNWTTVTQSDDGVTMLAAAAGGSIYKSTDAGLSWNVVAPVGNWRSVACSANCSVLVAAEANGKLYRSLDFGSTWLEMESRQNWRSVSISADGNTMLALPYDGQPYISTNRGSSWRAGSTNFVKPNWTSGLVSADGSKIFLAPYQGPISYSENAGNSWTSYIAPTRTTVMSHASAVNKLMHCGNDGVVALGAGSGVSVRSVAVNSTPWVSCSISADGTLLLATSTTGLVYISVDGGSNWTVRSIHSGNVNHRAFVATAGGNEIFSAIYGGKIEFSRDGGTSWSTALDLKQNWIGICASTLLDKIYAVAYQGYIYQSMDSGETWTQIKFKKLPWVGIACSTDGSKAVAIAKGGNIYNTTESGTNWTPRDEKRKWVGVTLSSNGNKVAAVVEGGFVYTSSNSGDNWTQRGSSRNWSAIASSSNGNNLVATVAKGRIYVSSDSGESWSARESNRNWVNVVSSSSGDKLIAVVGTGLIWTSSNSGLTWTGREHPRNWKGLYISGDGNIAFAADFGRKLYSSINSGETWTAR